MTSLINQIPNLENFPLQAMGSLVPVTLDMYRETKGSAAAIATSLLATLSLTCQGRIRVRKRDNLESPVSLGFIVEQDSGERKTSMVKRATGAISSFSSSQASEYEKSYSRYLSDLSAWKSKTKGLQDAIRKKAAKGIPLDSEEASLKELSDKKPKRPKPFHLIIEKATSEAITSVFSESLPTTALFSDEGGIITNGRALLDLSILCKAWDGSDIYLDSVSNGTKIVRDPTLTIALFIQRQVLEQYLCRKGELARGTGFLARTYVVRPPQMAGTRFLEYAVKSDGTALKQFESRCLKILNEQISIDGQCLPEKLILAFSPEAQPRWIRKHDQIESQMTPGGFFYAFKDFGSKHADKIARLAAILEYYETGSTIISLETLERAITISDWYATEFVRYFTPAPTVPQEQIDGDILLRWLANYVRTTNQLCVKKNDVRSGGPNSLRNIARLNAAIQNLDTRLIAGERKLQSDKAVFISMNPNFFTADMIARICQTLPVGRSII
ncbi:YfjI family protein [Propionivibrio dicarboxylicus]|uniref:DUF3987 domain-containing protein n=1 Tax=Propionivibrio dicarboxylicus TaxID=83767 RepID=A0A1G7Z7P2_9RHOO|nr:YfjI family protein [Propionivibrio dicarboxylicus]SDH04140.1 Protein of unknown function [Propionivibrio dicarboxylicus]